jgi:hypothetical protein
MRGTTAKNLRRIAREVGAAPKTQYGFAKLRGYWERMRAGKRDRSRTVIMGNCFRKAYKEAKKLYLGKPSTALKLA